MAKKMWAGILGVALVLAVAGCFLQPQETGSIYLDLGFRGAKAFLPPISMDVTSYQVEGSGPGSSSFDVVLTGSGVVPNLVPGTWNVTVYGRNDDLAVLGEGTGSVEVVIGATPTCSVTVVEYAGDGSMASHVTWEPDIIDDPLLTATVKNFAGDEWAFDYTLDLVNCTGDGALTPLPAGWYSFVAELWEQGTAGNVRASGFATAVRVAQGQETDVDVDLHAVAGTGGIEFLLDLDFFEPLELAGSPVEGDLALYTGETIPVSVSSPEGFGAVWYINGQVAGTGATYPLEAPDFLEGEFYRLDVVAFSTDGKHANSLTWRVFRYGTDVSTIDVSGTVTLTHAMSGEKPLYVDLLDEGKDIVLTINPGTIGTGATRSYSFGVVPEGSYYVRAWTDNNLDGVSGGAGDCYGYHGADTGQFPLAPTIVVPHGAGVVFAVTMAYAW